MATKRILFISQEITPYLSATEQSTFGKALPHVFHGNGYEARIFMPRYGTINERRNQLHEVIRLSGLNIPVDDADHPLIIKVATLQSSKMQVYFIDNDDYFHPLPEKGLETEVIPEENDERLMFFTAGVMETVKKLRWQPSVIHCSGWVSALAPLYLRTKYADDPTFRSAKIVYALQPEKFDGALDPRFVEKLEQNEFSAENLSAISGAPVDYITLNKFAIDYSDAVMQVTEDVDPALIEYAKQSGKPFLEYIPEEERKKKQVEFYRSLIGDGEDDF